MMQTTVDNLLNRARTAGIELTATGHGTLHVEFPADAEAKMGPLVADLREYKAEVLEALTALSIKQRLRQMNADLSAIFEPVAHPPERGDRAWTWLHAHHGTPLREAEGAVDPAALAGNLEALDAAIGRRCEVWRRAVQQWRGKSEQSR